MNIEEVKSFVQKVLLKESLPSPKKVTMDDYELFDLVYNAFQCKDEQEFQEFYNKKIHKGRTPISPNSPPGAML